MATQFAVDLKFSANGVDRELRKLQGGTSKLDQAVKKTQGSFDGAANSIKKTGRAAQSASGGVAALGKGLIQAAAGFATVSTAAALAGKAIRTAISRTESERRIQNLANAYGEAAQLQDLAAASARKFGQSQTETNQAIATTYARLRPLGATLGEIQSVYNGFNTAARLSGATAAEASASFTQLAQALGSGALRGDEFNSIAEQAPGLLQAISKETGVAVGDLRDYAAEGKITSDVVIRALQRIEREGADALAEALNGPEQKLKDLQNETENLGAEFGKLALPAFISLVEELTGALQDSRNAMKDLAAAADLTYQAVKPLADGIAYLVEQGGGIPGMAQAAINSLVPFGRQLTFLTGLAQKFMDVMGLTNQIQMQRAQEGLNAGMESGDTPTWNSRTGKYEWGSASSAPGLSTPRAPSVASSGSGGKGGKGVSKKQKQLLTLTGLALQAGFNPAQAKIMAAVALAESGGNPMAHNPNAATGDNSYGLWQINMLGGMGPERRRQFGISDNSQLFDPLTNAKAAKQIFDQQGFGAWSVYKSGAYRQFLGQDATVSGGGASQIASARLKEEERQAQIAQRLEEKSKALLTSAQERFRVLQGVNQLQVIEAEYGNEKLQIEEKYKELLADGVAEQTKKTALDAKTLELRNLEIERDKAISDLREGALGTIDEEINLLKAKLAGKEEEYRLQKQITDLVERSQGTVTEADAASKVNQLNQLTKLSEAQDKAKASAEALAGSISSALTDSLRGLIDGSMTAEEALSNAFKKIGDAFLDMAMQMIQEWIKMQMIGLIGNFFGGAAGGVTGGGGLFAPGGSMPWASFAGGGWTGDAPRAGGVDGQGGFPAILHPQEQVIDFADSRAALEGTGAGLSIGGDGSESEAALADSRSYINNYTTQQAFAQSQAAVAESSQTMERTIERREMQQQIMNPDPIKLDIGTTVINNVEYLTVEQGTAMSEAAARKARTQVFSDLTKRPSIRQQVGIR